MFTHFGDSGRGTGARHANAEDAAVTGRGLERQRAVENRRNALADRKSEAQSFFTPWRRFIEPSEFFENGAAIPGRDARARVDDLDLHDAAGAAPHTEHHAARLRVPQRIADEVLQHAPKKAHVRSNAQSR